MEAVLLELEELPVASEGPVRGEAKDDEESSAWKGLGFRGGGRV